LETTVSKHQLFFAIVLPNCRGIHVQPGLAGATASWRIIGFVWAYNLAWMIVQDIVKLGIYGILDPARLWKDRFSSHFESYDT